MTSLPYIELKFRYNLNPVFVQARVGSLNGKRVEAKQPGLEQCQRIFSRSDVTQDQGFFTIRKKLYDF